MFRENPGRRQLVHMEKGIVCGGEAWEALPHQDPTWILVKPPTFTKAYRNNCLNQVRHFSAVVNASRCSIPLRKSNWSWQFVVDGQPAMRWQGFFFEDSQDLRKRALATFLQAQSAELGPLIKHCFKSVLRCATNCATLLFTMLIRVTP